MSEPRGRPTGEKQGLAGLCHDQGKAGVRVRVRVSLPWQLQLTGASISPHSLLGGHPHPISWGRGPREGKARASKVPQSRSSRNRTGRPLKTQTQLLEMEQDSGVGYRACS